jgi:hypothetical protein
MSFSDELVGEALSQVAPADHERFTTDHFPTSTKAWRINVPLGSLPQFRRDALATGHAAVVTASYEVCADHLERLPSILSRLGENPLVYTKTEHAEESLRNALECAGIEVEREYYETFKYLRLRRNQIAHLREEPTSELAALVRRRGTHLMRFWKYEGELDFSSTPLSSVTEQEAIGILRFLRILVEHFDESAATYLSPPNVIADLDATLIESQPKLSEEVNRHRRARKLSSLAFMLYGLELAPDWIESSMGTSTGLAPREQPGT